MIGLYAAPTSNGLRQDCWMRRADYRHPVNLLGRTNRRVLALNLMGLIPTIIDPDGPDGKPMTLTQSMTILTYLATKTGKFIPSGDGYDLGATPCRSRPI